MDYYEIHELMDGSVRTISLNGETWWVAIDVCNFFQDKNYLRSINMMHGKYQKLVDIGADGETRYVTVVSEAGLYCLLMCIKPYEQYDQPFRDRMITLDDFQFWVEYEVLPEILEDRYYLDDDTKFWISMYIT